MNWDDLLGHVEKNEPVVGQINGRVADGLSVRLTDEISAFLPTAQVALEPVADLDAYLGQTHAFTVLMANRTTREVVVSRRTLLECAREQATPPEPPAQEPPEDVGQMFVTTDRLRALVEEGVEHALQSLAEEGAFAPFLLTQKTGEPPHTTRIFAESGAESIEQARRAVREDTPDHYAIVYDGAVTLGGKRSDAILVDAGERGNPRGATYAQRYRPSSADARPARSGERVLLQTNENVIVERVVPATAESHLLVMCPDCSATNRVSLAKLRVNTPRCGACKKPLAR